MSLLADTLSFLADGVLIFATGLGVKNFTVPFHVITSGADLSVPLGREPVMSGFTHTVDTKICALDFHRCTSLSIMGSSLLRPASCSR